jgi:hypothetical protein
MRKDSIAESLDTESIPLEDIRYLVKAKKGINAKENLDEDFDYVRHNLKAIIEKGMMSVGRIIDIATESEAARNIEAAGAYIKTLAELNSALFDMTKKKVEVEGAAKPADPSTSSGANSYIQNNNNAYILTTEDLIKMISEGAIKQDASLPSLPEVTSELDQCLPESK